MSKDVVYDRGKEIFRTIRVDFNECFTEDQKRAILLHVDHEIISAIIPLQDRVSELERIIKGALG